MSRIYLSPPHVSGRELEFVTDAIESNWLAPLGPHVDAFECALAKTVGMAHAAALSSGTAALHLALVLLGVGPGDRVIVSDLTFAATAFAVRYVGAEPVFVDADPGTWNVHPGLVAEALEAEARRGRPPKAAVFVDLYGQSVDWQPVREACARWDVPIVEDAAEALGATYRGDPVGGFGDFGVFSFNGNKIITTSGGGMLVSNDAAAIARARKLASQAREPVPHYEHVELGFNYRLSNVLAAIGRAQLATLADRVERRRRVFDWYRELLGDLPGVAFMPEADYGRSSRWLTCVTVDPAQFGATREDIRRALEAEDIEARPVWKPMHMQPVFADCRVYGGAVGEQLFATGLCLPSGGAMRRQDVERIAGIIRRSRIQRPTKRSA